MLPPAQLVADHWSLARLLWRSRRARDRRGKASWGGTDIMSSVGQEMGTRWSLELRVLEFRQGWSLSRILFGQCLLRRIGSGGK